jgi:DNA-binding protein H-NS
MKSYAAIKAEIAKLEKQAENLRKAEIAGVVARIKEAIAAYGLSAQDLGFGAGAGRGARGSAARAASGARTTVGIAKFRDPETGKTWTGRGKPPTWIAGVKDRTPFLIDASSATGGEGPRRGGKGARKGRMAAKAGYGTKRGGGRRKSASAPEKTPAVQIESGSAE